MELVDGTTLRELIDFDRHMLQPRGRATQSFPPKLLIGELEQLDRRIPEAEEERFQATWDRDPTIER